MARPKLQERKSERWQQIEARFGMNMERLLPKMFALHGGREQTAKALGIDPLTLDRWVRVCGYKAVYDVRTKLVPVGDEGGNGHEAEINV